ncbi:cytochrome P450 2F3-like [Haplochromis burtoni]|uniref:cytochrome P450 2F3-like n=1 Tax=Haplochromis burtoni TaxID=8153 RepID=UPI001C2DE68F|nr:cytochrome P450 2F3-like [Haplochromis burtoni]
MDKRAPFKTMLKLSDKYGSVMTMYLGPQRTVILLGYDAVKEALLDQADDFSGRGPIPLLFKASKGYGLGVSNGECWQQLRRFTLTTLRDFGMGCKGMEEWIQEESSHLVGCIKKMNAKPFDPTFFLSCTVSNVICCLVFGQRFSYDDKHFLYLLQIISDTLKFGSSSQGQLYNIFPRLMEWLPGSHHNLFAKLEEMRAFIMNKIQEHQDTLDASSPRDYIDCFLLRLNKRPFSRKLTLVGQRCPCMEDKKSLPYTDAVLHEIQRFLDIIPLSIPHYALHGISFRGYTIPKDTLIIPLLHSVLKDEKRWATPRSFNPQHFLDNNGNFKKNPAFLPFSAGKRSCVGESLTRMEIFLFLVSLLQHFTFSCPGGPDSIDLSPEYSGFANVPRRYTIIATPR